MNVQTTRFGNLEVADEEIITFPHGLPGFESMRQFVMVTPNEEIPFSFLQSVEEGDIAFILASPFDFFPEYQFEIPDSTLQELRIRGEQDVRIWSIVSVPDTLQDATANLLAPIVLNTREGLGTQLILQGTAYRTKHKLVETVETDQQASSEAEGDASCSY